MRRGAAVILAAAAIAAATYGIRAVGTDGAAEPARPVERLTTVDGGFGGPSGRSQEQEIHRLVAFYEDQVRLHPSTLDLTFLAQLYMQRGRLTGDVATYGQAEVALERALAISPRDPDALALLAQARFTTHDFADALRLAEDRLSSDPEDLSALAVVGDSRLELGDHEGATEAYGLLGRKVPEAAPVLVRLARLASLSGDVPRAVSLATAAEAAASEAGLTGADLAWYRSYLGQLELDRGRYVAAMDLYGEAVRMAPRYHLPRAGLGRALAAAGRLRDAIGQYRRAVDLLPDPSYVAALGDLYELTGRHGKAETQFATVEAIARLSPVSERIYNRQLAVFLTDHGLEPRLAVELAEAELQVRKDVYGWDAFAWSLYGAGRYAEARVAADMATRLGTADARLLYHAGMISAALGDTERARSELGRALDISPSFDPLHAPVARETLAGLAST